MHHSKSAFTATSWIDSPIPLDYGVSFFFVLSGFILTYSHSKPDRQISLAEFYVARFARVWPLHITTLLLCLALIPERARVTPDSLLPTLANLTLTQSWIPKAAYFFSYNSVSWSISTEVFFYLLFPFLAKNLVRTWHWKLLGVLAAAIAVLFLASTHLVQPYNPEKPYQASMMGVTYISPFLRIVEFFLGMLTALAFSKSKAMLEKIKVATWTILELGALALVAPMAYLSNSAIALLRGSPLHSEPLAEYLTHAGGAPAFMVVIFFTAFGKGFIAKFLTWRPLVILGEASFALYLVHQIFIGWYFLNTPKLTEIPNNVIFAAYWIASILTSMLLWRYIETPMRQRIKALLIRSK